MPCGIKGDDLYHDVCVKLTSTPSTAGCRVYCCVWYKGSTVTLYSSRGGGERITFGGKHAHSTYPGPPESLPKLSVIFPFKHSPL